jgi:hypothetical protein
MSESGDKDKSERHYRYVADNSTPLHQMAVVKILAVVGAALAALIMAVEVLVVVFQVPP